MSASEAGSATAPNTEPTDPAVATAAWPPPELVPAIESVPRFLRYPIFLPTERVATPDAIAGLARVKALYETELDATHRARLRAIKAARRNRRCFVIGNGPSLGRTDLAKLQDEVTFATNGFFLKMPELDWSPTYYVVEDHLVGEDRAAELNALQGTTKLFPASLAYVLKADAETTFFDHRPRKSFPDGFDFSFDADGNTWTGGTVTYTCLQLAAYLGYQEIYLIGVDADYAIPADATLSGAARVKELDMASDDPNHFHPDYFGKGKRWHEPNVETMLAAYAEARRATEARGVSIVNATVGGKLEVFPRIDYEMLFRPAPAEKLLVVDQTRIGDGSASGELKATILADWPREKVMQVYEGPGGRLGFAGDATEVDDPQRLVPRIEAFEPDLILYRPGPKKFALHRLAMDQIAATNLPLAVWIMDDWPAAYALEDPAPAAKLETDLRWLLGRADARFSISTAMSAAFHDRYGQPFVPIANGVDPADWPPVAALPAPTGHVTVRYAGSMAENMTLASVELVARIVERLADEGVDVSMEVNTHRYWHDKHADWLAGLKHVTVATADLPTDEYRRWLAEADVLLMAFNFDAASREYIRYSLANKLPECLASGAAILAVGPDDIGTIATMTDLDVGERVTTADEQAIADALRRLVDAPERRLQLAQHAKEVAFARFDVRQTRKAFEATVGRVAAAHAAGDYPRDLHAHVDETGIVAGLLAGSAGPLGNRHGSEHVMLDVGAQRGASAVHFVRHGWTIHCFEPHPVMRHALAQRFAERPNVHVDPRALGTEPATGVPLFESPQSSGIAALQAFTESHLEAATVDVTTVAVVVEELGLSKLDFLKIDIEGLDYAVLKTVPWDRVRPDVIECEFEDARTIPMGHSWRDMAAYLRDRGYAVYVSEWHPVLRYGLRHDWRRVVPFTDDLLLDATAWGNLLAFQADPGLTVVRRAFDQGIERGRSKAAPPPAGAAAKAKRKGPKQPRSLPRRILGRLRRVLQGSLDAAGAPARGGTPARAAAPANRSKPAQTVPVHGHDLMARLLPGVASEVRPGHLIEVGSTREKLPGQGSTVVLAGMAERLGLPFITVDMDPANTEQATLDLARFRGAKALNAKGEEFLASFDEPIAAAYLDAFDIQHGLHSEERVERYHRHLGTDITNAAAAAMHLAAAQALLPRLVPGGLVVLDDTWPDGAGYAGKGSTAIPELLANGYTIVDMTESAIALRSPGASTPGAGTPGAATPGAATPGERR